MSNNTFLQSKKQNNSNRFNILDSEEPNKKPYIKDKKPYQQYESSNNSFNKPSFNKPSFNKPSFNKPPSKDNHTYNNTNNDRNNTRNKKEFPAKTTNNHFKETPITPEFNMSNELFPSLTTIVTTSKNNDTNFKDALNQQSELPIAENITLRPGWIQITKINCQIIINQTNISPYDIKMQEIQELQEDPNYIMTQFINIMQKNWLKHKTNYDNIYGEDAYDDLHYLPTVYDSEYDTDENESLSDIDIDILTDY